LTRAEAVSREKKGERMSGDSSHIDEAGGLEKVLFNEEEMRRAISRIAHEIIERNSGAGDLLLVGLRTRGVPLAERLAARIAEFEGVQVPSAALDIRKYRDDLPDRGARESDSEKQPLPVAVSGSVVILVDDVLFTGRTIRAALEALLDYGRPRKVQLAVLIDRGHRELPIRADYTGKNVPTAMSESVHVRLLETDRYDAVVLSRQPE
jgi:pyrimidine operon attenuation protein/uracil phosphoribosyltransferase